MFENRHIFNGKLNNLSVKDLKLYGQNNQDVFKISKLDERFKVVNDKIEEIYPFILEYFSGKSKLSKENYFKCNLNSGDELSESNVVCKEIEAWTNYILGSDEVREERKNDKQKYKFYIDKTEFANLTNKEESLDGKLSYTNSKIDNDNSNNDDLIINFLLNKQGNKKKLKTLSINKSDINVGDYCSEVLSYYQAAVDFIDAAIKDIKDNPESEFKGKRYLLTKIKKDLICDMIYCKKHLRGIFGEKPKNLLFDSTCPSWEKFDWHEETHVKELLFLQKEFDPQDDLSALLLDLEILLEKLTKENYFTDEEIMAISCIRNGFKSHEIAELLGTHRVKVTRLVKKITKKIVEYTLDNWRVGSF